MEEFKQKTDVHGGSRNSNRGVGQFSGNKSFKFTPFDTSDSRLSIQKRISDIYSDNGTIYSTPVFEEDAPRWNPPMIFADKKLDNNYNKLIYRGAGLFPESSDQITMLNKYPQISRPENFKKAPNEKQITPLKNYYANQNHAQHEAYKSNMDAVMRRNGLNSVGMINDTKQKEIIDLIAEDRNEEVKPLLKKVDENVKGDFENNSSKKYEPRYKDNPKYLPKKKIPDYTSGSTSKKDSYNKLYTLPDEDNTKKELRTEIQPWANWDFVPFVLHDLVNKTYLPFRSHINSLSDQSDAEWQQIRYLGRADNVQIYTGFARTVSIDFTTACFSLDELHPMWQRLNYLVGLTKPANYRTDDPDRISIQNACFIIPPFLKLRLGDMYVDQPCTLSSVAITIPQEAGWEIISDTENKDRQYEYLNGTFTTLQSDNILVGQYPNMAQVNISFTFLEKRLPKTNNRHFGHYKSEDSPFDPDIPDEKGNPREGFNYNLIHPDPANDQSNEIEIPPGTEEIVDPDAIETPPDPFLGQNIDGCTTYPPSLYYKSKTNGNVKTKSGTQQFDEMKEWEDCACRNTANLMGLDTTQEDSEQTCTWENGCITKVNGKPVPEGLQCVFSKKFRQEPLEQDDPMESPPKCPYPYTGFNEKDEDGRLLGYDNEELYKKGDETYINSLKIRNLKYWIKDVSDYLAHNLKKPKIGSGPYHYEDGEFNQDVTLSNIRRVSSSNKSVVLEFDENGMASSYAGEPLSEEYKNFKINCTDDDIEHIREIAGNIQPSIFVDKNSDFKIFLSSFANSYGDVILDKNRKAITRDNFKFTSQIKTLLAQFVSRELNQFMIRKYGDLSSKDNDGTLIEKLEMYYAPYEEDRDKMVTAHKIFPGTEDYVYYEFNEDVEGQLNLSETQDYAELKIGFYALVSRINEKISEKQVDKSTEDELSDYLFHRLLFYNRLEYDEEGEEPISGEISGNNLQSDSDKVNALDPNNIRKYDEEIERLQKLKESEKLIEARLGDETIPVVGYNPVGRWTTGQRQTIINRMADMNYQSKIKELHDRSTPRKNIENYLIIMPGITDEDIEYTDKEYKRRMLQGSLVSVNGDLLRETDQDYLQKKIEEQQKFREDAIKKTNNRSAFDEGYYFSKSDSENFFEPWVADHRLEKFKFVKGIPREDKKETFSKLINAPKPITESPTPNRFPTWTWDPIENATVYEVTFEGTQKIIKTASFTAKDNEGNPLKLTNNRVYEIKVRAGKPSDNGVGNDWSPYGMHEVLIDSNSIPPKPPKCPYKVGNEGEKDIHGRLIGYEVTDPSAPLNDAIYPAIERNIKMWIGDVMAYVMANEGMGSATYPADPSKVTWSTTSNRATSIYEQNQMTWMFAGDTILLLGANGEPGFPMTLNGRDLDADYVDEFDVGCGPDTNNVTRGDVAKEDPEKPLGTPNPHRQSPTMEIKPEWNWVDIDGATRYKVSLKEIIPKYSAKNPGVMTGYATVKDYGVLKYAEFNSFTPPLALPAGLYEITVVAEETKKSFGGGESNETVIRSSEPGTHIVEVIEQPTPSPSFISECDDKYLDKYLIDKFGYCPRENKEASWEAMERWYADAIAYCICRAKEKNELGISESYFFSKSDFKLSDYTWDKPFGKWKYTEPSGMQMIREDFHKPQNISDTYHPSNMNSHPHGDIPMTTGRSFNTSISWSKIHKYWVEHGFASYDESMEGGGDYPPEDCLANPEWTPTPTPVPSGPFDQFVRSIRRYSDSVYHKKGLIMFYPPENKNKFLDNYDKKDGKLSVEEGIKKYSDKSYKNAKDFTVYQVRDDIQLPNYIGGIRHVDEDPNKRYPKSSSPPCYSNRIARDRVPNSYYKAPSKEEEQYILDYIKLSPDEDGDFGLTNCYGYGFSGAEATEFMKNYAWEDGVTPDKSPYWTSDITSNNAQAEDDDY